MAERTGIPTDVVSLLAIAFGAAVMVPSMIALLFSLIAVADILF